MLAISLHVATACAHVSASIAIQQRILVDPDILKIVASYQT